MKWVDKWDFKKVQQELTTEQVIKHEMRNTSNDGAVEELSEKVDKLIDAFAKLIESLPAQQQLEIVESISYGWEPQGEPK